MPRSSIISLTIASAIALAVIAAASPASASVLGERTYGGFSGYKAASTWSVPTPKTSKPPFTEVGGAATDVLALATAPAPWDPYRPFPSADAPHKAAVAATTTRVVAGK